MRSTIPRDHFPEAIQAELHIWLKRNGGKSESSKTGKDHNKDK